MSSLKTLAIWGPTKMKQCVCFFTKENDGLVKGQMNHKTMVSSHIHLRRDLPSWTAELRCRLRPEFVKIPAHLVKTTEMGIRWFPCLVLLIYVVFFVASLIAGGLVS